MTFGTEPAGASFGTPAFSGSVGRSAAAWPAILAGAFVATSVSLILFALGAGLGFAATSVWPGRGVSATTFTVSTAIWLIVVQWISAALGGYMAGRLRTRWVGTHRHEVFFRDTAHGLVTWSVATVFVAAVLASSASSVLGAGAPATLQGWGGPPSAAMTYNIDKLFRPSNSAGSASAGGAPTGGASAGVLGSSTPSSGSISGSSTSVDPASGAADSAVADPRGEAVLIAFHGIATGGFSQADRAYLIQTVQTQTGVPSSEAESRVDEFITTTTTAETSARAAADSARKAAAEASIYTALAMLVGAFIASVSAALGGRLRDEQI
jgi:hypothetical protein